MLGRFKGCCLVAVSMLFIETKQNLTPLSPPHTHTHTHSVKNPYRTICKRRYWPQLVITVLIPAFQQLTGINAIM